MQTNTVQTDAMQTGVVQTDAVTASVQTNPVQPDAAQTDANPTDAKKPADHIVALNNWLQSTPEGNVTRELSWVFAQTGPNNQAVHHATAKLRDVSLGVGQGVAKNRAKGEAAEQALKYLQENGLPPATGAGASGSASTQALE
ncbi:hypothetical protein EI94DRAFT_1698454 [Lactarius quietus]|nr:hypothetical protein EI94DRAFT_1698454 [Lactarius quietus]